MTDSRTSQKVRLGAVGYLNARPLVYGLDRSPRFDVRYDVPSECARLLHAHEIDVGLIPSIEYLRGGPYRIAPDLAIASRGPVASVAIYTTKPMADVRSIALDTSSRTSVALVSVLCARRFKIKPRLESRGPDLDDMLARCDAALIIGDTALFQSAISNQSAICNLQSAI
jgi:chorismate dehydratase